MPILNSVFKKQKLFMSEFFCPRCLVTRPYDLKPMSQEINFCQVAILEANEPRHVTECQVCRNAFDPEILKRNVQTLLKLASVAKYQLDKGISSDYLKLQLMSEGLSEYFADSILSLAQH